MPKGPHWMHELFEKQCLKTPDAAAVVIGNSVLTYRELNARANQLAHYLRTRGVGPNILVGVCLERSSEMIVVVYAVLKAGGAYVPLDPSYPADRLRYMLTSSNSRLAISSSVWGSKLEGLRCELLFVDQQRKRTDTFPRTNPEPLATESDMIYVIFTSGSTGRPKAAGVFHRGFSNLIDWYVTEFRINFEDAALLVSSLSFDLTQKNLYATLLNGGRLHLPRRGIFDPPEILAQIAEEEITLINCTPSAFYPLLEEADDSFAQLISLRHVFLGGEKIAIDRLLAWQQSKGCHCQVVNTYGPTECTDTCSFCRMDKTIVDGYTSVPIGKPVPNTALIVVDTDFNRCAEGQIGELWIGGIGVGAGYLNDTEMTKSRFLINPFPDIPGARVYRTGDSVRLLPDGNLEFLGRMDHQVKLRGFRIELPEIERVLQEHDSIKDAVVLLQKDREQLVAYYTAGQPSPIVQDLRAHLAQKVPDYMVPSEFVPLEKLPLSPNGKVDRHAVADLPIPQSRVTNTARAASLLEGRLIAIWHDVLGHDNIDVHHNFFDIGGDSISIKRVQSQIRAILGNNISITDLFQYPTVRSLARHLRDVQAGPPTIGSVAKRERRQPPVAIIGMSGRFPGANNIRTFWENLISGRETIAHFSGSELEYDVAHPSARAQGMKFVNARGVLENVDLFDADFFDIYPREAELMDPQHRLFLECAWEALESAGYDPDKDDGQVGIYAGLSLNSYLLANLVKDRRFAAEFAGQYQVGAYHLMLGNDKDFMPLRVAFKLNLRGPVYTVQSACSTSLVAICQAAQSLLNYQCDMALAGGSSITFPQKRNYLYQDEAMVSGDGHIHVFDARAQGTIFGHGVGVILLKRLDDAIADGDPIAAVIRGFAVNNDGSGKVGFAAPSVDGQAEVIATAQSMAGVHPDTVSYIEAHGTGTPLGDPIEIAALTQAFRAGGSQRNGFCAIGSVKPNVGHLEVAAGVTGMIKTILCLQHKDIPSILHFEKPNPKIDFDNSPFYPVTSLIDWNVGEGPRRAGVSAFGVGGTNAHVVLEEAPIQSSEPAARSEQLFLLSARTAMALDAATANLAEHLRVEETMNLADIAYTLQVGRRLFSQRRYFVSQDRSEAIQLLSSPYPPAVTTTSSTIREASVGFLFPGQGAQRINMGRGLYESEEVFRSAIDRCAHILKPHIGLDLREKLYPSHGAKCNGAQITETALAQPSIFAVEYALSQLWMSWGLIPSALLGHSIGEYVAAVIAEVFSLEDTLGLLAARARLMQDIPKGSMMVVFLPASTIEPDLPGGTSVAAENGPAHTVISGPDLQIRALEEELNSKNVATRYLVTSHAFHSSMMDHILDEFTKIASEVTPRPPRIPWVSTYTGGWMTTEDLHDPAYWSGQLRHRVKFADALDHLMESGNKVLLEAGAGQTLTVLAHQQWGRESDVVAAASLPNPEDWKTDVRSILQAAGRLWAAGLDLDWKAFHGNRFRKRVSLPTYPFERKSFWIEQPGIDTVQMVNGATAEPGFATQTLTQASTVTQITSVKASHTAPVQQQDRRAHLVLVLQDLITELSGLDSTGIEESASFVEIGFDSLLLTQFSTACQSRFGVKITFRQMFSDLSSVSALADYLDRQLPADRWQPQASPPQNSKTPAQLNTAASSSVPAQSEGAIVATEGLSHTTLDQIIAQQYQVIRQLEALNTERGPQEDIPEPIRPNTVRLNDRTRPKNFDSQHKTFGSFRAVQVERVEGLEQNQCKALEALTMRYTKKTARSKKYTEEHHSHFADPRAVAGFKLDWKEMVYPIVASKSRGSSIWDLDGNEYIDITMGFGSVFFGHSPEWITKELHKQLELGVEIGPQSCLAGEVARLICEFTGMDRVTFCNTGSEAVMASLRLARTVTGREKVVMFKGSYHGTFDEILTRPVIVKDELRTLPIAPGVTPNQIQNMIVLDYGTPESLELIREQAGSLAAVLVEPVQSRHPENQPREFLHEIRRITRESGTALIFDEVVTGFRCHLGGAQAWFGVEADIATYGKVVGGGMPIGFIAGRRKWMDPLDGGEWHFGDDSFPEIGVTFFAGTFVRHPLAMAAAYTALRFLKEKGPSLQESLNRRVETLVDRLNTHFECVGAPLKLLHFSSFFVIQYPSELYTASLLWYYLREKGIHVWEGFPCYFTLAHSDSDMDRVARAFEETVAEMQAVGLLPTGDKCSISRLESGPDSIETENHLKRVPITIAQQEMWFATQISDEANSAFNESMAVYFRGDLQWDAFERALRAVVTRHEALRSVFSPDGSLSLVRPEIHLEIPVHDLRELSPEQRDYEFAALRDAEGRRVFDLGEGPLLATQMVLLSAKESVLLFTAHHIACDSWSYAVVLRELSVLYTSYVSGEIPQLGELTQMSQYVKWERDLKASSDYTEHEQFWVSQYRSMPPPIDLPFAAPRPPIRSFDGARQIHIMPSELTQSLREFGRRVGTTLFSVLLAGFQSLLHRLTGSSDIVIGIPYAGQNSLGAKNLVGHYANTLPLRVSFPADVSFADFVRLSRDTFLEAYEHRDYTFGSLIQKLRMPRDPSRVPIVSVTFNFEPPWDDIDFAGLTHRMELNPRHYFQFDFGINVVHEEDRLRVECDFNSNLFDSPSIERLLYHYETLLREATNAPELLVSRLIEKKTISTSNETDSSGNEIEEQAVFIWD